jgi:hypothetical protein
LATLAGAMAMNPSLIDPVPDETARVAQAAFSKGTLLIRVRDEIGVDILPCGLRQNRSLSFYTQA